MDPHSQLSFHPWCKKIEGFLQAGETLKDEHPLSLYALLPSTWHVMMLDEKRNTKTVIDSHGGVFSVDLRKALRTECSNPYKEIHPMLTCYSLTKKHPEHPEHLGMTPPTSNIEQEE
jgi:hypothetical protein